MRISKHAARRMFKRRISSEVLWAAVEHGKIIPGRYKGTIYRKYNNLCVVVDPAKNMIVTIFWE